MKKLYSIFLGIILFCSFSHAEIFYVSTTGNDSNDGKSWETAYANVQTAIDAAAKVATSSSPAQVWVAKGTYAHGSEMLMKSYIEVYGGFIGNEKSLYERVPSNKTILSGEGKYTIFKNVYKNTSYLESVKFDAITFSNGYSTIGGAFNNSYIRNMSFVNCEFVENKADHGAALYCTYSTLQFDKCSFIQNDTRLNGTIFINGTFSGAHSTTIKNSTFYKNTAYYGSVCSNGKYGILNLYNVTMTATVSDTKAGSTHGALYCYSSNLNLVNCILYGNFYGTFYRDTIYQGSTDCIVKVTHSLVSGGWEGDGNIDADPKLGEFGDYGGFVRTIPVLEGSILISSGKNGVSLTDARGFIRPVNPTIGAYEFNTSESTKLVLYVTKNGNDSNDGRSWATSYANVQTAIDAAAKVATGNRPSQVWVAKGTYTNPGTYFQMKPNVEIYGGFAGTETELEDRTLGNETILTVVDPNDKIYDDVIHNTDITQSAKLDMVTVTGGKIRGINNRSNASPTITNCTIADNGHIGIENRENSSSSIINCTITNHKSGGIHNRDYSSPVITNCTIANNSMATSNDRYGIFSINHSNPIISNCTIVNNIGTGILNTNNSNSTITNSIIWGNVENEIYNDAGSTTSISYSAVKGGYSAGTNIITEDPMLGELGNYGGFVDTIPVLKGSSAIASGTTGENIPTTDARGVDRDNPPTIGAYEYFTSFDVWAQENNLTGDNAKPEAIPNSDGITNLEKFTFGLDASKATSYAESGLFKQTNDGTNVSFQYPVNKAATDVTVKALISEDLIHWTEISTSKVGESGNMNLFEVNWPIPDSGKLFFKVEVTQ